jgi:hypothetical protein
MRDFMMRNVKWYYIAAAVVGLGAIVAIVYIVVRSGGLLERINHRRAEQLEGPEE